MELVLFAAQSLDGRITRHDEAGTAFVSAGDQVFLKQQLATCDASIMGANTYRVFRDIIRRGQPAGRRRFIWTRQPARWVDDAIPGSLEFSALAPAELFALLRADGRERCALLGGSEVYQAFLAAGLVSSLWLTLEPRLFGGGLPLVQGTFDLPWRLIETRSLGGDTLAVHYRAHP